MKTQTIEITLTINNVNRKLSVGKDESLLDALRRASYFSVKCGCDDGICGICTVLLNGTPVRSCMVKAVDAEGKSITTVED
jgi:aerobic-type carbon monoxide dehydrogenase small subunit (CoxS/CutS family)